MTELESERRWFHPRPDWLLIGLLAATGFLFLCDRFHWFAFGEKKGWAVLMAVAGVGVFLFLTVIWFVISLVFRRRFQFSLRSLLILVAVVALPFSWLASEMRRTKRQQAAFDAMQKLGVEATYDYEYPRPGPGASWAAQEPPGPGRLRNWLGVDFFADVFEVTFHDGSRLADADLTDLQAFGRLQDLTFANAGARDADLERVNHLASLRKLRLQGGQFTDESLQCLRGLTGLEELTLLSVRITDAGLKWLTNFSRLSVLRHDSRLVTREGEERFRQAMPNCRIEHWHAPE
jgi:hypothetical protein